MRVAKTYFTPLNRTVATLERLPSAGKRPAGRPLTEREWCTDAPQRSHSPDAAPAAGSVSDPPCCQPVDVVAGGRAVLSGGPQPRAATRHGALHLSKVRASSVSEQHACRVP